MLTELINSQELLIIIPIVIALTAATKMFLGGEDPQREGQISGLKLRITFPFFGERVLSFVPAVALFWSLLVTVLGNPDMPSNQQLIISILGMLGSVGLYGTTKNSFVGKSVK